MITKKFLKKIKKFIEQNNVQFNLIKPESVKGVQKKINTKKDMNWNNKIVNSKLLKGIERGSSIDEIEEDFFEVENNNKSAAMRIATTMVTYAACSGKRDSSIDLEDMGIINKKVWIATPDERVRDEHLLMDGEEVDPDEDFSNGCSCPGDPKGDPATTYNCRCDMKEKIIGFMREDGSISEVEYERPEDTLHNRQIAAEKSARIKKENEKRKNKGV